METVLNTVASNLKLQHDRYEVRDSAINVSIPRPFQQQLKHLRTVDTITTETGS